MKNSLLVLSSAISALLLTSAVGHTQESAAKLDQPVNSAMPAETSSSKESIKEVLSQKKFSDDSEITDTKLKADEGSRSQYSLKFSLSYSGPPIGNLNSPKQPNPDGSIGTYDTRIGGAIGGRLRLSPETALNIGTGATALQPLQGVTRYDLNNPFISYDVSSKWNGLQIRNTYQLIDTTNPDYMKVGETGGGIYTNAAVYNLGTSRFALELDTSLQYWVFNRGYVAKDTTAGVYFIALYPYLKYNATEKFNVNTSFAIQYMNPRSADWTVLTNKTITEQIAFGYAFTKDIYFSPNINFYPAALMASTTTVNFTTTFSLL